MQSQQVLIIDDEPAFANYVRRVAEGLGYEAIIAANAQEFKDAFSAGGIGIVVVDVVMPEVDGIEILNWLAEQGCEARVLVMTGFNPYYTRYAKAIGAAKGLPSLKTYTKPISLEDLRNALR